jgi:cell division septum initiation protein DivIVA
MDGSQLLLKTDFPEARRGYDKTQVDEYLRALSEKVSELRHLVEQATQRAEDAEAALATAVDERRRVEERHTEIEAALRTSEATRAELAVELEDARVKLDVDEVEVATGILGMAKRTAEAAMDEATQRVSRMIEDAEVQAAVTQLEAERRAERTRRTMEEEVAATRRRQLDVLQVEVDTLTAQRDALQSDVVGLQAFVSGERQKLREGLDALCQILEPGGSLSVAPAPPLTSTAIELTAGEQLDEDERRAVQVPSLLEGPEGSTPIAGEIDRAGTQVVVGGNGSVSDGSIDLAEVARDDDVAAGDDAQRPGDHVEHAGDPDVTGAETAEIAGPGTAVIDLTKAGAGTGSSDPDAEADAGDGALAGADPEASSLGTPRAAAEAAMREFFEGGAPERRGLRRRR